jgi:hypothetical protein
MPGKPIPPGSGSLRLGLAVVIKSTADSLENKGQLVVSKEA